MRLDVALVGMIVLIALAPPAAAHEAEGPRLILIQHDGGNLLTWTPVVSASAYYHVKMGPSPNEMQVIATTITPFYHAIRQVPWDDVYYGVSSVVDGTESGTTIVKSESGASCVYVGLNGKVQLRPHNCFP